MINLSHFATRIQPETRSRCIDAAIRAISSGISKGSYQSKASFDKAVELIERYEWGSELAASLRTRRKELVTRSNDNDD